MNTVTLWAVADPKGRLLTHTLDESKAQAVENFRASAYPRARLDYWFEKGYKAVEVTVYMKADAATLERQNARLKAVGRAILVAARSMWWAINHMAGAETIAHFVKMARRECGYMLRLGATSSREADITGMRLDAEAYETHRKEQAERGQAGKE